MKFKTDENLPIEIIDEIRSLGHEADTVLDEGLKGFVDPQILGAAKMAGCVLLTMDKGIANVRLHPPDQLRELFCFDRKERAVEQHLSLFGATSRHCSRPNCLGVWWSFPKQGFESDRKTEASLFFSRESR